MMIHSILQSERQNITKLFLASLGCFLLLLGTNLYTQSIQFIFLLWNLFLAGLPYLFILIAKTVFSTQKTISSLGIVLWLLFLPNSFYILTDFFHLPSGNWPMWLNFLIIAPFAFTGFYFGICSLNIAESLWYSSKVSQRTKKYFIPLMSFLSAFGVYLGRFERFNSWDVIQNPLTLLGSVAHRFIYPTLHPRTWAFTLVFGLLIWFIYNSRSRTLSEN